MQQTPHGGATLMMFHKNGNSIKMLSMNRRHILVLGEGMASKYYESSQYQNDSKVIWVQSENADS